MASRDDADEERAAQPAPSRSPSLSSTSMSTASSSFDPERLAQNDGHDQHHHDDDDDDDDDDDSDAPRSQASITSSSHPRVAWLPASHHHQHRSTLEAQLYASHLLSTANSRLFEFGAVLFLAALFPRTLLPMSVYALARSAAAILLAHPVGACIDRRGRLAVVRASIVAQRVAVAASCAVLWAMHVALNAGGAGAGASEAGAASDDAGVGAAVSSADESHRDDSTPQIMLLLLSKRRGSIDGLFAVLCVLACVEKLAAMANLVAVERDWVVVMTEGDEDWRRVVNARMRRIDLFCKLLGPLFISLVTAASTLIAIWTVLGLNVASVLVEYICIARVYKSVPALQRPPPGSTASRSSSADHPSARSSMAASLASRILPISSLPFYVRHPAFLPSFSLALLYLTVLSFSGQMVAFLLSVGYTPLHVGLARTGSTAVELSATWAAPWLVRRVGAVRGGIWSLSCQMVFLAAGLGWFLTAEFEGSPAGRLASATGLAVCVAFSRLGLWGYDLCAQAIVQDVSFPPLFCDQDAVFRQQASPLTNMRATGGGGRVSRHLLDGRGCVPEPL
ncbi:hypothetical protein JDV02_002504 [Purpureocillium takamizusanense]|uniref:Solute carrier family 40 member n=1 Tax=Purpureocillium takamizusanense TaxID=2060973 RepID=A0A9Q8Q9H6_9HYPO|nr:uncharacterized protein JDV02_002504 [Purpureocillium takamizusanense]UNI16028.1 hypothetical protein JDV02_002504 [Purpureocillium takamizusanense]